MSGDEFAALRGGIWPDPSVATEFLDHGALDRPRVTIFPDGRLVIPHGRSYYTYGRFLDVADLGECLDVNQFSAGLDDANPDNRVGEQRH